MPLTDSKFTATTDLASPDGMTEMLRQETLLKTGALQKAIFNSANFSSIATDANGVIQIFNVGAERMLGYAALEVLNKITPADISDPQEVIARAKALSIELGTQIKPGFEALVFKASRGIEDIYELTYIRKDGSRFPAVVSVTALRDDQDIIIGYLLIGTDNTARKGAEAARLTSEARLDGLIASALDAIIAIDSKHCVTLFNTSAENMFGLKAADVLGARLDRLLPARFRAAHNNHINQFGATGFSKRLMGKAGEILGLHADGHEFPIEASISQLEVNGEKMFTVMLRDITERKKAEEALLKAGALQSAIFNSANFSSIATDARGVIQIFNVGAERMLGYAALEVMNTITPADISDPQEVIARAKALSIELGTQIEPGFEALVFKASRGIEDIYELTYIRKDGSRFPAMVSVTALRDAQDVIIGYLLIGTDNTVRNQAEEERKKLDQRLQENNVELQIAMSAAEKANLAKSEFLSSMSHELRTPLSAILGFAQLIESGTPPPSPTQKRSVDQILLAGWYLLNLINEILDLALIESGKLSLSPEPVWLAAVMHECEDMIEPQAQKRDITMVFPDRELSYFIKVDRTRIKQILINLLSNAIKYNRRGGKVVVQCIEVSPGRIRICVEDTGQGLSLEKIAQLFQPFNRLGQEAHSEEGTGIGLVMTKRLVELMGGVIGVESTVGEGSIFWIETNLTDERQTHIDNAEFRPAAPLQLPVGSKLRTLLYVEDNPANLMLVETLIDRRPDLRLLTAVDGYSGIEIARMSMPDIILMDINLPGISGIKALKILNNDPATAHIPVVALSANAMPRDIEKGLNAGFFKYLTKPLKINEFMETLDEVLKFSELKAKTP